MCCRICRKAEDTRETVGHKNGTQCHKRAIIESACRRWSGCFAPGHSWRAVYPKLAHNVLYRTSLERVFLYSLGQEFPALHILDVHIKVIVIICNSFGRSDVLLYALENAPHGLSYPARLHLPSQLAMLAREARCSGGSSSPESPKRPFHTILDSYRVGQAGRYTFNSIMMSIETARNIHHAHGSLEAFNVTFSQAKTQARVAQNEVRMARLCDVRRPFFPLAQATCSSILITDP